MPTLLSHKEPAQGITIDRASREDFILSPSLWHKRAGVATSRSNGPMLAWINLLLPGMLGLGSTRELLTLTLWDLLGLLLAVDTVRELQGLKRETKYREMWSLQSNLSDQTTDEMNLCFVKSLKLFKITN